MTDDRTNVYANPDNRAKPYSSAHIDSYNNTCTQRDPDTGCYSHPSFNILAFACTDFNTRTQRPTLPARLLKYRGLPLVVRFSR
jgi:hypothetical protein